MENGTNTQVVSMKLYTVDQPIPNWVLEHRDDIYFDVLIQCEESLKTFENSCHNSMADATYKKLVAVLPVSLILLEI